MADEPRERVLLVRAWTEDVEPVVAQLRAARLDPEIVRVDFEAALYAVLVGARFDLVVLDDAVVSHDTVVAALRENSIMIPIVAVAPVATLAERVEQALRVRRS